MPAAIIAVAVSGRVDVSVAVVRPPVATVISGIITPIIPGIVSTVISGIIATIVAIPRIPVGARSNTRDQRSCDQAANNARAPAVAVVVMVIITRMSGRRISHSDHGECGGSGNNQR